MSQILVTGEAKIRDIQGPVVANSGVITALDGAANQYVRGDGTLAIFPTSSGGGSSVSYYLNGSVNQGTFGGSTYYQMSRNAIVGTGTNFSTSSDGLIAQFITDANDPDVVSIPSGNWNVEFFMSVSASSGALASFYVEIYKYNGSTFTLLATNVATPEQLTNTTTVDAYFTSVAMPLSAMAVTDRLAVRVFANVASKTVTLYTEDNRLCQIVTTFSNGLTSLNNLTDQSQYLTTGTSGTDFNIVSSGDTHTFNLPSASASNRGLITTGAQTIAGAKVFDNPITANSGIGFLNDVMPNITSNLYTGIGGNSEGISIITRPFSTNYTNNLYFGLNNNSYTFPDATGTIALTSDLSSYVPYTGATGSVNLGLNNLTANNVFGETSLNVKILPSGSVFSTGYSVLSSLAGKFTMAQEATAGNLKAFTFDFSAWATNTSRTYTLPDLSGTLALLEGSQTFTGVKTFSENPIINGTGTNSAYTILQSAGTNKWRIGNNYAAGVNTFDIFAYDNSSTPLSINSNGAMTLSANVTTTGAQFVQNGFYLTNANGGSLAGYTHMWGADDGINFGLRNGTGGARFIFPSVNSYIYTFPASSGTLALTSNLSAYLPLTGGTLTGALSGTSATFTANTNGVVLNAATGTTNTQFKVANTSGDNYFGVAASDGSSLFTGTTAYSAYLGTNNARSLHLVTNGTVRQTIDSTGAATFSSSVTAGNVFNSFSGTNAGFEFGNSGSSGQFGFLKWDNASNYLYLGHTYGGAYNRNLVITSGGNVGIGTSSPATTLTVYKTRLSSFLTQTPNHLYLQSQGYDGSGYNTIDFGSTSYGVPLARIAVGLFGDGSTMSFGTSNSYATGITNQAMTITSGGDVLVGTTSNGNSSKLVLFGGASANTLECVHTGTADTFNLIFTNGNGLVGSIRTSGSSTSYYTTSDYRLKNDLKDYNGLELISKIKTYDFAWNVDNSRNYGVMAHELQEVIPYAVGGQKDAEQMQGVDYSKIVPILVKSIQELEARIKQLENK